MLLRVWCMAPKRAVFVHSKHELTLTKTFFVKRAFKRFNIAFFKQLNVTREGISIPPQSCFQCHRSMAADSFFADTNPAWLLSYERTSRNVHFVASKFYRETDRNEKYWIKNTRQRSNLCLSWIFILSQS